jgi:hypothetical protein
MRRSAEYYIARWGGVSGGKGADTAKDQMKQQNALQQQAFQMQQDRLNNLYGSFGKYLNGTVGLDPGLKAALQSQFQNQVGDQYNQASSAVKDAILAHGGNGQTPIAGSDIRAIAGLEGSKADTLSSGTLGLNIADLQQALTNQFNAGSLISGNAATLSSPIATFGSGASNALDQYIKAANSGFGAAFTQSLGGTLGKGLGAIATGGFGALANAGATALGGSKIY